MLWLWYVAPFATLVVWFLTGLPGRHEARRDREIARWRALMVPETVERKPVGYREHAKSKKSTDKKSTDKSADKKPGPRQVTSLPGPLFRVVPELGGGVPLGYYELIEKLAYVAIMGPNLTNGSEYQVVLAKLARPAPWLMACPLPIVDGARLPNTGVQFKKDPDFMGLFMVEGPDAKAIGKWLSRPVRDALRDFPDAWLHVEDRAMALVLYGPVDAERLQELIATADTIFAEHGAEGGPSLLAESEDEPRKTADEDDGDEEEEDDEDEDDAPAETAVAKTAAAGKA